MVLIPAFLLLVMLIAFGFRWWSARQAVLTAAESGARSASLASSARTGGVAAQEAAQADLMALGVDCSPLVVATDTVGLDTLAGTTSQVSVTVTCTVSMADLLLPGAPGRVSITRTATERVDTFRER